MSIKVSFFTPIEGHHQPILTISDSIFSYGEKKAVVQQCSCHITDSYGVKMMDNDTSWAYNALRVVAFIVTTHAIYQIVKSPLQVLQNRKLHLIPLATLATLFAAKVYDRTTTNFHVCPRVEETIHPDDLIDPAVKPQLNALTDGISTTDNLEAFSKNGTLKFEEMTAPIMKGIFPVQGGEKPYIAIKVCRKDRSDKGMIVLTTTGPEHLTQWMQHPSNMPQFFKKPFTAEDGKIVEECFEGYNKLKAFITNGHCLHDGVEWIIPGHPKLKVEKDDKISEPVRTLLNELIGKRGPIAKLPILKQFKGSVPKPKDVDQAIMKYYGTDSGARPAIVFKLRHGTNNRLLILAQASEDAPNVWKQVKPESIGLYPDFFDHFTDDDGDMNHKDVRAFNLLKDIIENGSGEDLQDRKWALVT